MLISTSVGGLTPSVIKTASASSNEVSCLGEVYSS